MISPRELVVVTFFNPAAGSIADFVAVIVAALVESAIVASSVVVIALVAFGALAATILLAIGSTAELVEAVLAKVVVFVSSAAVVPSTSVANSSELRPSSLLTILSVDSVFSSASISQTVHLHSAPVHSVSLHFLS